MKSRSVILILSVFLFTFTLSAQIPAVYYDTATGSGYTLKSQLHEIINGHTELSYTPGIWDAFYSTDVDRYYENDGSPLDMYSENPIGVDYYNFEFGTDEGSSSANEGDYYNREHSFPRSWFGGEIAPMNTDIFHIYLTDVYVNNRRSSYPFGETDSPSWTSLNGSKVGASSYPGYSGDIFEPIDEFKGDFARTYFYMATRYENVISSWPGSAMLDGSADKVFTDWALNMLIEWHTNDPVSQKEIDRNNTIYYNLQNNRNPFIDNPNYVYQIWGGTPVPFINFVTNSQQIEENIGSLTVYLSISEAIPESVTANLVITGTADDPDDYTASTTAVYFPPSSAGNQSTVLTIEDDLIPEDFETIILTIDNLTTTNPDVVIGANSEITVTINNSDGFDETPPAVDTFEVLNDSTFIVTYTELVDPGTSQVLTNYSVNNGVGSPSSAILGYLGDSSKVELSYPAALVPGAYQLTINNVEDLKSNVIAVNTTVDFGISSGPGAGWIEDFNDIPWSGYTSGTYTLPTGDWDIVSVYPEESAASYEGASAVRLNDDTPNSSLTTPSINGVDSVIFHYRALNPDQTSPEFVLQKSVDGGAYTNLITQGFEGTTYNEFAYKVNDSSDNIKIRVLNDDQYEHLIVDYFKVVTFSGPVQDITPPTIQNHVVTDSTLIITFDEILDPVTSQTLSNYDLDNGVGNPSAAVLGYGGDSSVVETFFPTFLLDTNYQLTINNVEDPAGNPMITDTIDFIINSGGTGGGEGWIEYFEDNTWTSYTTDTFIYPTGDWDFVSVYQEPASEAYEGEHAVRMNDDTPNSSITSPAVNGVDSVIFYYRTLNSEGSPSTFWLQKSVDGGAFTNVTSQSFQINSYNQFAYKVNDTSDNIRLRILNNDQTGHLIVDNFEVVQFPVANDPEVPANIVTSISGTDLVIDWDVSADATGYDIYASDDPYGVFTLVTTVGTNQYVVAADQAKMFYYIVAKN